ncbi:J domain-containing protein [Plasmodiophora brassicae]|nr:hypothetical protein PBRA_009283 [Plasmodiophora brassicae]
MQRDDFYNVLGVERYATASEIRQAYRKLAIKYHPDKHANASEQHRTAMADAFREVQRAYEILSDEDKRRQYDLGQPIADGGFAYDDIEEAFLDIVRKTGQAMMRVPSQEVAVGSAVSAAIGALGGYVIGTITAWTSNRPGRQSYPALYSAMGLVLGASAPIIYSSVQQSLAEIEPSRRDLLVDLIHQILLGYAESRTGDPQDDTDDWR